ncbi:MAG: peptidoglycan-associated lipoprotein Pal [Deltaproteobacteria bacterium]|jgi:peptidoglycan-associated lipoprotein|nr:peptidoglycan-associated lipoprotein Pal [Deltaproteobacteria bacterium]
MNKFARFSMLLLIITALFAGYGCTKGGVNGPDGSATDGQAGGPATIEEAANYIKTAPVYFAYDRFDLDATAKADLKAKADLMKRFSNIKVQVEGHCDERGTEEYNLALGERRARAAYDYLLMLGVNPAQLSTHSYGKMYPAVQGNSEEAWSKNRRDEFRVTY